MATFGKTDIGGSSQTVAKDNKFFTKFQISENGITTKITVYLDNSSGSDAVAKAGIYTDDNGSPDLLLVNSSEVTVADGLTDWVDFTLASTNLTSGADYWIAVIIGDQTLSYYYDAGTVDQSASDTDTYSDGFESEILLWLDDVNRADDGDLGLSWQEKENTAGIIKLVSNEIHIQSRVAGGTPGRGFGYFDKTHNTDVQFSKLIFKSEASGISGPSIRIDPDGVAQGNVSLYQAAYDPDNTRIDLYEYDDERLVVDGTILDTYSVTLSANDAVWLEGDGTSLTVKVNGSSVITATSSAVATGNVGLSSRALMGSNGALTMNWDNWAGGDIHTLWDRAISMYVTYTAGAMATGNLGLTIVGAGR